MKIQRLKIRTKARSYTGLPEIVDVTSEPISDGDYIKVPNLVAELKKEIGELTKSLEINENARTAIVNQINALQRVLLSVGVKPEEIYENCENL